VFTIVTVPPYLDPVSSENARQVFNGMAVIYGFFFILLSAIVAMAGQYRDFVHDLNVDPLQKFLGLATFYLLVMFAGFGTAGFGAGLSDAARKMAVSDTFTESLMIVTLTLPLIYSASIGFLVGMPWFVVTPESIIVELYALERSGVDWRKKRSHKRT